MSQHNELGEIPLEVKLGIVAMIVSVVRARFNEQPRPWSSVFMDVFGTVGLIWLAFNAFTTPATVFGHAFHAVPESWALLAAAVCGILGWEAVLRLVRRVLRLDKR